MLQRTKLTAGGLFIFAFAVFLASHVHQVADSKYSLLLSQSLIERRSFTLNDYGIPQLPTNPQRGYVANGDNYQIEVVDNHLYYYFPPGSSLLSLPFVAVLNGFGVSALDADGNYDQRGGMLMQYILAALLMAGFTVTVFCIAGHCLPLGWSLLIAFGTAFGTQVYSTATRALWSDTWSVFLLGLVALALLKAELKLKTLSPVLMATLLSWSYFTRPTNSVVILAVTAYIGLFQRDKLERFLLTGGGWLSLFIAYAWFHFHQLLPNYFQAARLSFKTFPLALAGNLISPARGVLIYVPTLLFIAYLLLHYRRSLASPRLALLCLAIIVAHLLVVSCFDPWHGGHCFGVRYMTGAVPWFALLATLALTAWRTRLAEQPPRSTKYRLEIIAGSLLLACSIGINLRGATAQSTWQWNVRPANVDERPERLWDWRNPQFLAH